MQGKLKYIVMFVVMGIICISNKSMVQGYTGTGSSSDPYIVTKESELREILNTKGGNSWKYVAVNNDITIRSSIVISRGKFRIYARGAERMLKRSGKQKDFINDAGSPKFCIVLNGSANVVFGYANGSGQILRLGGNKANFTGNKKSSGFVYVGENATATLDSHALLTNVRNNKSDIGGTAIFSLGSLVINGEISNCEGTDGGAVGVKNGSLEINSSASIHHCSSQTEGGGVFGIVNCNIAIKGGTIRNCTAKEEGGGLFVGGASQCVIESGNITSNTSGLTGGGIFSGNGAMITIGKIDGSGPVISYNKAGTVGGGIRCNGGLEHERGGTSFFYGGYVSNNTAEKSVGGISCGTKGDIYHSNIFMRNMYIQNNNAKEGVGGIRLPSGATGMASDKVYITNCSITGNSTDGNCAGLKSECNVVVTNCNFTNNYNKKNGGAVYIDGGIFRLDSGNIRDNVSSGNGDGVYVAGEFRISNGAYIDENNEVYLTKGRYIDVINKIHRTSGLIAQINSEVNANGTRLVKVSHSDGTASEELYHYNVKNGQRYRCISMSDTQLLRPSENVNGYEDYWIIISEKYKVQYNQNTMDNVENMPETQEKYWNENIVLHTNEVSRKGYSLEKKKHWNSRSDGLGSAYIPGSVYEGNGNVTLYAIWKKLLIERIYMNTVDRYYVVGQNIVLNRTELLKKITTDDNLHTGRKYELKVKRIDTSQDRDIARGSNIETEKYINTNQVERYILTVEAGDAESGVRINRKMYVYVLNTDLSNGQVRFISYKYLDTLDGTSKWNHKYKQELTDSLIKEENDICEYDISISNHCVKEIKQNIKNNNYKIDNGMNRSVVGKLEI